MKIKSFLAKPFANYIYKQVKKGMSTAITDQENTLQVLLKVAEKTDFGKEHEFSGIKNHVDFIKHVPIRNYEQFVPYINLIKQGRQNVLWKGQPIYFSKTSGTTSGVKYIPITKDSIPNHIDTARNALLCYMAISGNNAFANGKLIFLSGSPELERVGGIPTGRLSGIVNHHVPRYMRSNQLPSFEVNCIEDWETKLEKIIDETIHEDMRLISGIPPWMQMYFDKLIERSGKKIKELFPNFSVMVQGGVNFEPYKSKLIESIGQEIDTIELFPASEGFFAFQDNYKEPGLLLNTCSGIYFEFIPINSLYNEQPERLSLAEVRINENYVLIVSTNAGLWSYNTGDTIKFISIEPYRILVTGRVTHFISAFGEHVIGEEVEYAISNAAKDEGVKIIEFTVAPMIASSGLKSYHEWFIEFDNMPNDMNRFSKKIDDLLRSKNIYYNDLINGNVLDPLKISIIEKEGFRNFMKSIGKLGGQNKVPRLSNDRKIAEVLEPFKIK